MSMFLAYCSDNKTGGALYHMYVQVTLAAHQCLDLFIYFF